MSAQVYTSSKIKIAIVTGGSRGLGRSTALCLAARGIGSIITYKEKKEEAEDVIALIEQAGARAITLKLDTGDTGAFDGFVGAVRQALARLMHRADGLGLAIVA